MPLDPEDPKVRLATFGKQAEHFLQSDLGRYLTQLAAHESDEAARELKKVSPEDRSAIVKWQIQAQVADRFIEWVGDAIAAGEAAIEQLKAEHE